MTTATTTAPPPPLGEEQDLITTTPARRRIDLVPWDVDAPAHVARMYAQRVACGWRSGEVRPGWVELSRAGRKMLYWVVLRDEVPDKEDILARHLAENPEESTPIHDTASAHWHLPRQPSHRPMIPIGHIALDLRPEQDATLPALPPGEDGDSNNNKIVWVAGLFISYALQAHGLGREAMYAVERLAAREDLLRAGWAVLDTMEREQQLGGGLYAALGRPVPPVATQDWYERQGYVVFATKKEVYKWTSPVTGEEVDVQQVFLRKKLT